MSATIERKYPKPERKNRHILPPGLTPFAAAQFGLWLLGQRQHARLQKRLFYVPRAHAGKPIDLLLDLLAPWLIHEYPGRNRIVGQVLGISHRTARDYVNGRNELPSKHLERFADLLEERARRSAEVAAEFRAEAAGRAVRKHRTLSQGLVLGRASRQMRLSRVREARDARVAAEIAGVPAFEEVAGAGELAARDEMK